MKYTFHIVLVPIESDSVIYLYQVKIDRTQLCIVNLKYLKIHWIRVINVLLYFSLSSTIKVVRITFMFALLSFSYDNSLLNYLGA